MSELFIVGGAFSALWRLEGEERGGDGMSVICRYRVTGHSAASLTDLLAGDGHIVLHP